MDDAGYLLSEFDASWVVNNAGQKMAEQREFVRPAGPQLRLCKNGASAIAARSGSTISSQSCTLQKGSGGTIAALTDSITVYNLSTTAVAANAYIIAALVGDIWIAVWEDC